MTGPNEFPLFIKAEYQGGNAMEQAEADIFRLAANSKARFAKDFGEIEKIISKAVAMPRTSAGGLDLGVAEAQRAAAASSAQAQAAREVAQAMMLQARETNDVSQETAEAIVRMQSFERQQTATAAAARASATQLAAVQQVMNRQASAVANATNVTRLNTVSAGAQRAAYVGLGQQLTDATVQFQMGTSALTVFTQQVPQAAFALSNLGGVVGRVGTFLAGPWGAALFAATAVLGGLTTALLSNKSAFDGATGSAAANKTATDALAQATMALDEITGRLTQTTDQRRVATALATEATKRDAQAALAAAEAMLVYREAQLSAQRARAGNNFSNSAMAGLFGITAQVDAERESVVALRKELDKAGKALEFARQPTSFGKYNAVRFAGGVSAPKAASSAAGGGGAVDKEARAAQQAVDQLESKIRQLESRFDPATSAAREFADALEAINKASARGIITPGRAQELSTSAIFAEDGRTSAANSAAIGKFLQTYQPIDLDGVAETADAYVRRVSEGWKDTQAEAAAGFARALQTVDIARSLTTGRGIAGIGRGLASGQLDLGNPEFADAFAKAFQAGVKDIEEAFSGALTKVLGPNSSKIGDVLGQAMLGAQIGSMSHDIIEGFGIKTSKLGSEIGGALGSAFGPLGSLAGSIVGGLGVQAFKPAQRGSATIGGLGGELVIASTRGNSRSRVGQSVETADEAITTLERIAEALGGTLDASRGAVSIGVRGDNFRVDTTGSGITKTKKGAVDFGQDSAAAIRFATMDLIQDGVIQGLRASTQRLLQTGKDLESAITKAVDFQSVFDRLQARIDPVGAAVTGLDREFTRLRDIFGQAQASAAEYADLEKLFVLERADAIKAANDSVFGSLQSLLDDLRFGDNGRSLRDRLAGAQANFDPLSARVQAGDLSAYDDFAEAARTLLDIQRQFSGSQTAFFSLQDQITAITANAVEGGNITSILAGSGAAAAQADSQRAFESAPIVDAIGQQTNDLINGIVSGLGREIRELRTGTSGGGASAIIPGFFAQSVRQV